MSTQCGYCQAELPDPSEEYCPRCGMKAGGASAVPSEAASSSSAEAILRPGLAMLSHPGRVHPENQDAMAESAVGGNQSWHAVAIADGVSSSRNARAAAHAAAETAVNSLAHLLPGVARLDQAMSDAILEAHRAVCALPEQGLEKEPPGTTLVVALGTPEQLVVGWVGDSRAYWLSDLGSMPLTRDHSWVADAVATGEMTAAQAELSPMAHALTHCLGPLELVDGTGPATPEVRAWTPTELPQPGVLLLCTDGLWNCAPEATELRREVFGDGQAQPTPGLDLAAAGRRLLDRALDAGGGDNITLALLTWPTITGASESRRASDDSANL